MGAPPSGTVTLLFSDIEGSTALVQRLGGRYGALLADVRAAIRAAIESAGGVEIDCRGDEFFVVFAEAPAAVGAAVAVQHTLARTDWPDGVDVRVRIGVHTGSPQLAGDRDYVGLDVHRAARVCSAGHGAQILLSESARNTVPQVEALDLGEHDLPGLPEPERLFQVLAPGLPHSFPPLRAAQTKTGATRVAIADDSVLLREGIALLLEDAGFHVVAQSGDADALLQEVAAHEPHVVVVDIRMPPTHTDEGLRAARTIRRTRPGVGVLVLSSHLEEHYAQELLDDGASGVGYLLKERVADVEEFAESVRRIAAGGVVLDRALSTVPPA